MTGKMDWLLVPRHLGYDSASICPDFAVDFCRCPMEFRGPRVEVQSPYGHFFERKTLEKWFANCGSVGPWMAGEWIPRRIWECVKTSCWVGLVLPVLQDTATLLSFWHSILEPTRNRKVAAPVKWPVLFASMTHGITIMEASWKHSSWSLVSTWGAVGMINSRTRSPKFLNTRIAAWIQMVNSWST